MRAILFVAMGVIAVSGPALGANKKKGGRKTSAASAAPPAEVDKRVISELMGSFTWGMTLEQVLEVIGQQIDERFAERIHETSDVYAQSQLRKKADAEKEKIRSSLIKFEGKETSWDVSIIDDEFWHKNGESMVVLWEVDPQSGKDQRRFFFFLDGKLWKTFVAFNADMFAGKTFADFRQVMEKRYGPGAVAMRKAPDGTEEFHQLVWRSDSVLLRAIDQTKFYGIFCLALSDLGVESTIQARREERNPRRKAETGVVDAVTDKGSDGPQTPPADNSDVVDRITGGK